MKQITLDSICIENFRSFARPTAIEFTAASGLKFISGANQLEPALGANGAGKSTVFDAICFALYGVSVRGLRGSELVSYGQRSTTVLLMLVIDGELYAISRSSPGDRLTINNQPAKQPDIDNLVGLSRTRFLNSVIFGQAVPLFIDLPRPARGDLLDDVLRLGIWLDAAERATARHREQTDKLAERRAQIARLDALHDKAGRDIGELRALEDAWGIERAERLADAKAREQAWDRERDTRLRELIDRYDAVEEELAQLQQQMPPPPDKSLVLAAENERNEQHGWVLHYRGDLAVRQAEHDRLADEIGWLRDHDHCPTCGQDITAEFKEVHHAQHSKTIKGLVAEIAEFTDSIATATKATRDLDGHWQQLVREAADAERARAVVEEQCSAKRRESDDVQRQAVRVRNETNPYSGQRQAVVAETNPYTTQKTEAAAEHQRLAAALAAERHAADQETQKLTAYHYWRQGFRQCRAWCLDGVLAELTLETRNSLLALGLAGWQVEYQAATETKSGTVRLGVEAAVKPPDHAAAGFAVLSGGESQRVRLAASLGLASLVQRWAGVQWNTEVFDEPTAWLSEEGVEDLLDCLAYRAMSQNKSIWVADHRGLQHASFTETMTIVKDAGGSRVTTNA